MKINNEEIKISVIVPVFNQQKYLRKCLDSIINQSLRDIEIICIDDGSTDLSFQILSEYNWKDNRVQIFSQNNKGVAEARNFAINQAKGKYLAFIDSDDWYYDDTVLEEMYNAAERNNALVCGGCFTEFNEENGEKETWAGNLSRYTFDKNDLYSYDSFQLDFGWIRYIYNRDFIISNKFYFPNLGAYEDPVWFVKVMDKAKTFYGLTKKVYVYRTGHKANTFSKEKILDVLKGINEILIFAKEKGYKKLFDLQLFRLSNAYIDNIKQFLLNNDKQVIEALDEINKTIDDGSDLMNNLYNKIIINKEKEINVINDKLNNFKDENNNLKETIRHYDNEIINYKKSINDSINLNEELKSSMRIIDEKNTIIKQINQNNEKEAETIKSINSRLQKELDNAKVRIKELQKEIDETKNYNNELQKELNIAHNSYNWKLGSFLLFIPKKIYYFFKGLFK